MNWNGRLGAAGCLALVAVFGCGGGKSSGSRAGKTGGGPWPEAPLAAGAKLPALKAKNWLNGTAPANLGGKVVVISAWASWCTKSRADAPELVQAYQKYKDDGVVFIGLTRDDGALGWTETQKAAQQLGLAWPNGYAADATLTALGVVGFPTLFVVGPDGRVAWNDELGGKLVDAIEKAKAKAKAKVKSSRTN